MYNQITKITMTTCFAAAYGLTLTAEAGLESDPWTAIGDAHVSVTDAIDGVIDGVCYRDIQSAGIGELPDSCPDGTERNLLLPVCEENCSSGWREWGYDCYKRCRSGYSWDGISKKCRKWFRSYTPDRRSRDVTPLQCSENKVQDLNSLCYDQPESGYDLFWGMEISECPAELPYECGVMCTTDEAMCTETLEDQGMSAA